MQSLTSLRNSAARLSTQIKHWLTSGTCVLCHTPSKQRFDLCENCMADLPWLGEGCIQCALPIVFQAARALRCDSPCSCINYTPRAAHHTVPTRSLKSNEYYPLNNKTNTELRCGVCLKTPPPYDETFALWQYQMPISNLIARLKFQHKLVYAKLLGELMAAALLQRYKNTELPQYLIPVPLHQQRLIERGYNQALELARPIARKLQLPLDIRHCHRIRATAAQTELPATERHKNLRNAFSVSGDFSGQHIAIIDDVMTTGHTVAALSQALRRAGAARISVWCCARTSGF